MNQILHLLRQRRVWAGIVAVVTFVITLFGVNWDGDAEVLTNLLHAVGESAAALISGLLALWSYLYPKK